MSEPVASKNSPYAVEAKAGEKYFWCACGRSAGQPFCDGAHKGTGLGPRIFTAGQDETLYLCGCRRTRTPPFCDGTHSRS